MTEYVPELGQMCFGQPYKRYEVDEDIVAYFTVIEVALTRYMERKTGKDYYSPFGNYGGEFKNDVFEVQAYSWSDDEQPYNFKYKDIEVSWYKHYRRGVSSNIEITLDMAHDMLIDCLESLK